MIRFFILFFVLFNTKFYSQGTVGLKTIEPSESFDNGGTLRIRDLPLNNATNAISTFADGTGSSIKNQTFKATRTVVADANGVLGVVEGLPVVEQPDVKQIEYVTKYAQINSNLRRNSITTIGNLGVYVEVDATQTVAYFNFCLLNTIVDNVNLDDYRYGSGGGPGGTSQQFLGLRANPTVITNLQASLPSTSPNNKTDVYWKRSDQTLSVTNRDFGHFIIMLINTKEVYRVSLVVNGQTPVGYPSNPSNPIPINAGVTIFIERLTNE